MAMTRCHRVALLLALVGAAPPAAAQVPIDSTTRSELLVAREAVWRAFFQGDSVALLGLLPERMVAMEQDRAGIIRDALAFQRSGATYRGIEFSDDRFFLSGNTAILWSHYVAHTADPDGTPVDRSGRAIELFVKVDGRWINPHWHLDSDR